MELEKRRIGIFKAVYLDIWPFQFNLDVSPQQLVYCDVKKLRSSLAHFLHSSHEIRHGSVNACSQSHINGEETVLTPFLSYEVTIHKEWTGQQGRNTTGARG